MWHSKSFHRLLSLRKTQAMVLSRPWYMDPKLNIFSTSSYGPSPPLLRSGKGGPCPGMGSPWDTVDGQNRAERKSLQGLAWVSVSFLFPGFSPQKLFSENPESLLIPHLDTALSFWVILKCLWKASVILFFFASVLVNISSRLPQHLCIVFEFAIDR